MQSPNQLTLPAEVISKGVDWMTCTSKVGESKHDMRVLACNTFQRAVDSGETPKARKLQGYDGYAIEGFFHGEREGSGMAVMSGHRANDLWRAFGSVSDNVSRMDLQVTVWTILERPHVARIIHEQIKRGEHGNIRVRNATYIEGHPNGETVNLNKRRSDNCARVYDKASEGSMGLPRTIWRYEVECRRRVAVSINSALRSTHTPAEATLRYVWDWFDRRGIRPIFAPHPDSSTLELKLSKPERNTLAWFRDTLSKTVQAQVRQHGRAEVMRALGLAEQSDSN